MKRNRRRSAYLILLACSVGWSVAEADTEQAAMRAVVLPMERTTYFIGELLPVGLRNVTNESEARLEAVNEDGRVLLYQGPYRALLLDTSTLAPGDYTLELNGVIGVPRITLTGTLRRSPASMQDEATPPKAQEPADSPHWDDVVQTLRQSGISTIVHMAADDTRHMSYLDPLARAGTTVLANPDTRPTSFFPTRNVPEELDSMTQRLLLGAQANGRYPNFGGYCYGWDTTGHAIGGRKGLMVYWGWGQNEKPLRNYIERVDEQVAAIFRQRTGMEPVSEAEYISYLLSIKRPEFATMIDLPTRRWLREISQHTRPMADAERVVFEKRLDAWSSYLMGMYGEVYAAFSANMRPFSPSFRHTASVQVDHSAVRNGQYFPEAYTPLDFQYQSTWNDQVGGPDYAYQWLFTAGLLDMHRGERPTWLSNAIAAAHHRAAYPGKFSRVAAHGLPWGVSGIGFALEGFSNLLGGMNRDTNWSAIRDQSGGADVLAARQFLDRFVGLSLNGSGDHGVGILFSKSQFARQHVAMGFGQSHYLMFVALTRLGYTPRFVTEEELASYGKDRPAANDCLGKLKALILINQTFPVRADALDGIRRCQRQGIKIFVDASTTIELPDTLRFEADLPFSQPGKPHNWSVPNMVAGDNDSWMFARWYASNAPKIAQALEANGKGLLRTASGVASPVTLLQLEGGRDARYIIAVNDSFVATQADWYQVREKLEPASDASGVIYDLTEEKFVGPLAALDCDLTKTTVRVFGVLPRRAAALQVRANQEISTGQTLALSASVLDAEQQIIEAVIPLQVSLFRPDGKRHLECFRATSRDGLLALAMPIPSNVPAGTWQLAVHSQLDGTTVRLPIKISSQPATYARAITGNVLVRGCTAIEPLLEKGQRLVVPVFDSPQSPAHRAAVRLKEILGKRGVDVDIRQQPAVTNYVLSYDPDESVKAENAKADRGEAFGVIQRKTTNRNDWFCALSGWRFGLPVVLFDLVGTDEDNPPAESLDAEGLLWPNVCETFPGPGRAVIHGVHWALAPRVNIIVVQAADAAGLIAGAEALAMLPKDLLSPSVESARSKLWQQRRVGEKVISPSTQGLTAEGATISSEPAPFRLRFPRETPPTAEQAKALAPRKIKPPALSLPISLDPRKDLTPFYYDDHGQLIETATVGFLVPDLRFNDALRVIVEPQAATKTKITITGLFRTADRLPKSAAQWEDVLGLYEKQVPRKYQAIEVDVQINRESIGKLTATKVETREIPLEMGPSHGTKEVRTAKEKVVTEISGEVDIPAGRQGLFLIHHHIVDGMIEGIGIGTTPIPPSKQEKTP